MQNDYAFASDMFSATEGMPLIRIRDLRQGTSTEIRYTGDYDDRFVVKAGDFLIGMDGEFRCYEWKGADGLLNQRVCRLIDFGDVVDPEFVRWGIDTHLKIIEENTPYVTVRHLSAKKVKAIQFSFPSLGEQRRIVARIKECMERVEEIDTLRCDSRKQASAILPAGRFDAMKGDTPTVALGDIIQGGPTNGLYKPAKYYGSGTPILRIDNFDAGQVLTEPLGLRRLEVDESELHRYALQPGSIVLNRVNGSLDVVGKACLIDSLTEATLFESNMMAFSVDGTRADPVYVLHFLASPACRDQIKSKAKVIQQASINQKDVASFTLPLPRLTQQRAIAQSLDELASVVDALRREALELDKRAAMMRDAILRKAFAGEL